jgi:hypothetical protein
MFVGRKLPDVDSVKGYDLPFDRPPDDSVSLKGGEQVGKDCQNRKIHATI